ncbi:hypothetical protein [Mesorhizobium sp. GbtcB19]|uniref:hypothetical protein n=1 Tax=Mesorhizobium sp. GbtcB19 TaxID=2824764 RepID=UPI001C2F7BF1|nr:hypothetical protein [Mesorhizobium sp. GbtcB19]
MNAILKISPAIKVQSLARKSRLVTDILTMPNPESRADTILATTAFFEDLDQSDRSRLIDEAIDLFGEDGPHDTFRRLCAADSIVQSLRYLEPKQVSKINEITDCRLDLCQLLSECLAVSWLNPSSVVGNC